MVIGEPAARMSFQDNTPKERSGRCGPDRSATQGLYERLPPESLIVFRGARVITMVEDETLDRQDVYVRNARIEMVTPTGGTLPDGAVVIAAEGRTLIPGLSEIHGHPLTTNWGRAYAPMIAGSETGEEYILPYDLMLFIFLANGITRLEVMAGCTEALWMRDEVAEGRMVGPKMTVGSPLIDGPPLMHSPLISYSVGDLEGGRRAGDQAADLGYDFAKPYTNLPAEGYEGLMQACERRGFRVMGHVPAAVEVEFAIRRGQQGIAHAAELFYNLTGPERTDAKRRDRLVRLMADRGMWLQATVCVTERLEGLTEQRPLSAPDRHRMHPLQKALWADNSPMYLMIKNPEHAHFWDRTFDLSCAVVAASREAGVSVLTGTDFPNPFVVEGYSLHEELLHLVESCGFTEYEALAASTTVAAAYHGEAAFAGTITTGARADLVLLADNPLVDINATRSVETVLLGDVLLRKAAIVDGLARVERAYQSMPEITLNSIPPASAM